MIKLEDLERATRAIMIAIDNIPPGTSLTAAQVAILRGIKLSGAPRELTEFAYALVRVGCARRLDP
jgi:hypothetical protein